jgi:hypothetical protein
VKEVSEKVLRNGIVVGKSVPKVEPSTWSYRARYSMRDSRFHSKDPKCYAE